MISANCDFEKFLAEVKGKDYDDVIYMAEKEATETWRRYYNGRQDNGENPSCRQYQDKLIGLIDFMRHGLKPRTFSEQDMRLCSQLQSVSEHLQHRSETDGYTNLV